jgi:tRNA threonylcarbamoyl adenosine modification protein (Sua5/YciO/YrdC/YwlC family)
MKKIATWQDQNISEQLLAILRKDGIIASSTDTILGLLAPLTQGGWQQLNEIKHREQKPYIILISDREKAGLFCDELHLVKIEKIMKTYWPGPLTIILPAKNDLPDYLRSKDGTVALRVPDHAGLQKLLIHCDGLFSTSANLAGQPVPHSIQEMDDSIKDRVDALVIDAHPRETAVASTIIDCTGKDIRIVREGAIKIS